MPKSKQRIVRVGLIKAVPKLWDLEGNWRMFEKLARNGADRGAQILCTPETFLDGYVVTDSKGCPKGKFNKIAQPLRGESYVKKARELAKELNVYIVFGFTEKTAKGNFNAAALIDRQGKILGCYHKTHLLDHDKKYLPGRKLSVWNTELGKIGIVICADRRWPESVRTLKIRGAEIIMNPTYGMCHYANEWWMRTRAYENELFYCFNHAKTVFIAGPRGDLIANLTSNLPDVLVHDIDLSEIQNKMFPHRRPDVYAIK